MILKIGKMDERVIGDILDQTTDRLIPKDKIEDKLNWNFDSKSSFSERVVCFPWLI